MEECWSFVSESNVIGIDAQRYNEIWWENAFPKAGIPLILLLLLFELFLHHLTSSTNLQGEKGFYYFIRRIFRRRLFPLFHLQGKRVSIILYEGFSFLSLVSLQLALLLQLALNLRISFFSFFLFPFLLTILPLTANGKLFK